MRRIVALLLVLVWPASVLPAGSALGVQTQPGADIAFASLSQAYLDGIAAIDPVGATVFGDHRGDARLPDLSTASRGRRVAFDRQLLGRLAAMDRAPLSRANQVDAILLDNALRYDIWQVERLQAWAWDPQAYNNAAGSALYALAARDFAPWPDRLRSATARMAAMPVLLAETRRQLIPARVPAVHAATVARQNGGIVEIAETMLVPHRDMLSPADRVKFDRALAGMKQAVAVHQRWLDTVLVPRAKGDFRLGPQRYDEMVRFALVSSLDRAEIKRRATVAFTQTRAQMYAIARGVLPTAASRPPSPTPAQQQAAIAATLELTYAKRPQRADMMAAATATLAQATAFVRANGFITVPDTPVQIIEMPKFQQGVAVAYCDSPGPLEAQLPTFYAISPIPGAWSDDQATSFLREYNTYMLHDLSIHEAMPGHYLQGAIANGRQSPLRAVLSSGPFVEGWAVYAEGEMMDRGYLDHDPLFKLTVLKMRLRSITNALLDIGIQTEGLTRAAAMDMMTRGAFQQEREAAGKWTRATLGAVQLLSYFTGYSEHVALRREAERRAGAAFDAKAYHDKVLSFGSPPMRYMRALMFDEVVK